MRLIITLLVCMLSLSTFSQVEQWGYAFGNDYAQRIWDLYPASNGDIIGVGLFEYEIDFDPSDDEFLIQANSNADGFVIRLNSNGELIWAKNFATEGASSYARVEQVKEDNQGNIIVKGELDGTADFDPGNGTNTLAGDRDVFVVKLDDNGDHIWSYMIPSSEYMFYSNIAIDDNNAVYLSGGFRGTIDADPGDGVYELVSESSSGNGFVIKLDGDANFQWAHKLGQYGTAIKTTVTDADGNIALGGSFRGTVDFDPSANTYELTNTNTTSTLGSGFLWVLDTNGEFVQASMFNKGYFSSIDHLNFDNAGNIIFAGEFGGNVDFDLTGNGNHTIAAGNHYIIKMDAQKNITWSGSFVKQNALTLNNLFVDSDGNIFLAGTFQGQVDFDPSEDEILLESTDGVGDSDAFYVVIDKDGNGIWGESIGGSYNDEGKAIIRGTSGNVCIGGDFIWKVVWNDHTWWSTDQVGFYLAAISSGVNTINTILHLDMNVYPNPSSDVIFVDLKDGKGQPASYKMINLLGEIVLTGSLQPNQTKINVSELNSGYYLLEISNSGMVNTVKVALN